MRQKELTVRQREILGFIKDYIGDRGYPPSLREICGHFGIKGPKNAGKHLDALEKKGFIRRGSKISRAIEVVDKAFKNAVSIPIVGQVRAGTPHLAVEDIVGHMVLDTRFFKCTDAFILKVVGESMTGAGIDEGDYLVIRPQKDVSNGDIVVALLDGEATVKRFCRGDGEVTLKPENPSMEPIRVREGGKEVSVIGKVISVLKKLESGF
ncbi:MAG: repressor LexA [Deltaproteobacteria bacterium]|nr:repressor LexA [Deltaproteobacteria bacterium]